MTWGQQPEHPGTRPISGPGEPPPDPAYPPTAPQAPVHPPYASDGQQPPPGPYSQGPYTPGPYQPPPGPPPATPGPYPQAPQTPYPQAPYPQAPPTPHPGSYPGAGGPQGGPPYGGPPTGPHQFGGPPYGGPPHRRSKGPLIFAITAVLVVLVVGVTLAVVLTRNDAAEASEIFLQPQDQPGPNPFTESVATAPPPQATVPSTVTTTASSSGAGAPSGGVQSLPAAAPGLYGGTENSSYCDPEKMVVFLEANPDKAAAWASVIGIRTTEIRSYVKTLTPVLLRSDTRVTNHGFANGQATVVHSVLQAGTAVLVDKYGTPRVKCNCGNPLTVPTALRAPRYTGPQWRGYNVTNIIVVQQSTTVIIDYVLYDPVRGGTFERPAGTNGTDDRPVGGGTSTTTEATTTTTERPTTTAPQTTTTPLTRPPVQSPTTPPPSVATTPTTPSGPPPPASASVVIGVFTQRRAACLQDPNLNWPFKKATDEDVYAAVRTGDPYVWNFTALNHPPGETQTWTWTYDARTGRFAATNALASQANAGCRTLEYGR